MGENIDDFDLPQINENVDLESGVFHEKFAYDEIMWHVHNDIPGVFFIDGPGGTGKTFLYKALLANIRSCGRIALATASSCVAANNMRVGRTTHSCFKIPLNLENNSVFMISRQSGIAQLLRIEKVIVCDEASMAKRHALEAVDRTMKDITGVMIQFGGNIMVLGDYLLRVGDGVEETVHENFIRIPDDMTSCLHPDHRHPSRYRSTFVTPSNPKLKPYRSRFDGTTCKLNVVGNRGESKGEDEVLEANLVGGLAYYVTAPSQGND
ncbi:unnamed protein product [Lactuca saligna]|uniref:ATP-dependent DNA helicase n=1 Tax=Lactuca saligna TaxID=75948 RepID=A0AA35Z2A2_LACSI|nr:unnamed protein product [Lactuca saligna]